MVTAGKFQKETWGKNDKTLDVWAELMTQITSFTQWLWSAASQHRHQRHYCRHWGEEGLHWLLRKYKGHKRPHTVSTADMVKMAISVCLLLTQRFVIEVKTKGGSKYFIYRRYREFLYLHQLLGSKYAPENPEKQSPNTCVLPTLPGETRPPHVSPRSNTCPRECKRVRGPRNVWSATHQQAG